MSDLVLTLREPPAMRLDASPLAPNRLAGLDADAVRRLPLRFEGGTTIAAGDLFSVEGRPGGTVRMDGDLSSLDAVGGGMTGGTIRVTGSVGHRLGCRMTGGSVTVAGDAGDEVGTEMAGGTIVVRGSVGRGAGSASAGAKRGMSGGEVIVFGNAGSMTGACLRRGVIAVAGRVGPDAARAAIAGTVVALGGCDPPAGRWMKRASLVALEETAILPGFLPTCTFRPSFVAVLLTHLRRTYGFPSTPEQAAGIYRKFQGDMAELGRGEILLWTGE